MHAGACNPSGVARSNTVTGRNCNRTESPHSDRAWEPLAKLHPHTVREAPSAGSGQAADPPNS